MFVYTRGIWGTERKGKKNNFMSWQPTLCKIGLFSEISNIIMVECDHNKSYFEPLRKQNKKIFLLWIARFKFIKTEKTAMQQIIKLNYTSFMLNIFFLG